MAHHEGKHGEGPEEAELETGKLSLISSPIVGMKIVEADIAPIFKRRASRPDVENMGFRDGPHHHCPEFQKHEEATNVELFFDLFFAAGMSSPMTPSPIFSYHNLTVFSEVHDVTDQSKLTSYVGYFCMLWFTWALVGLFDVRFVTDSIFERIARAAHLGVMVGFTVVAPNFNPDAQIKSTFRAMSLILMVSRLILSIQYATIIWHVRKFKTAKEPLAVMVAMHFAAAMIYLGITFRFQDYNSRVYIAWYIVAICETLLNIGLSLFWPVLSFKGTHIINRMGLLTLIIIGEGVIVVCTNVTTIVKNPDSWTPATVGVVTSAVATMYFVYQIYFDWKRHLHLPPVRQLIWVFLHFPFHLALTLFVEGSSQFIIWWKILEVLFGFDDILNSVLSPGDDPNFNVTTSWFVNALNTSVNDIFDEGFSPKYYDTVTDINDALQKLSTLPDSFWARATLGSDEDSAIFNESVPELYFAVQNSLFAAFNIDAISETTFNGDPTEFEEDANNDNWARFVLVFIYTFAAAGLVLILMNTLLIVARTRRWGPFNYVRAVVNYVVGLGLALVPLITFNPIDANNYEGTPWILPTLCLAFFFILVLNHLPHPPPWFFAKRGREGSRAVDSGDRRMSSASADGRVFPQSGEEGFPQGGVVATQAEYDAIVAGYQQNPGKYQNHYVVYQKGVNSPGSGLS